MWRNRTLLAVIHAACAFYGCRPPAAEKDSWIRHLGSPERGKVLLATVGCNACHEIPSVVGSSSRVAAPLDGWAQRTYISGVALNTPELLVRWIMDPQALDPGTVMPNLHVSEPEARDMAAYLYTLQ
jgi:cytochrome c2